MTDQTEPIQLLVDRLARLPGLGPRSARRVALHLLKRRNSTMREFIEALRTAAEAVRPCHVCGSLDTRDPCRICRDPQRDPRSLCVVEDVADVWALERARVFSGRYHVLGGTLNALDGVGPEDLMVESLMQRAAEQGMQEVILALSATVDGQVTAHYVADRLRGIDVRVTRLAQGVPVGGELDYLDEGTLGAALAARRAFDTADPL